MNPPPRMNAESLLAHTGWLKQLALQLTRDPERADELAQQTWVAALEHPPREGQSVRGWLATVLRNFLAQDGRRSGRRAQHEALAARDGAEPSALELVERVATQRALSKAVLELREPYRAAILLRFYDDLPPRAIAKRLGVPVSTVKTRIARGLALLREQLDRRHGGDGQTWLAALAPVLSMSDRLAPTLSLTAGGLAVSTTAKLLALALSVGAVGTVFWMSGREEVRPASSPLAQHAPAPAPEAKPLEGVGGELPASTRIAQGVVETSRGVPPSPAASAPAAALVEAVPNAEPIRGSVLDARAEGVGGVRVGYARAFGEDGELEARSDADGHFTIEAPEQQAMLIARGSEWATVLSSIATSPQQESEAVLVVAPALALGGLVVDEAGAPVAGATVEVILPTDLRARFEQVLDYSSNVEFQVASDVDGRFLLEGAPLLEGAALRASLAGYESTEHALPGFSDQNLRLVLQRPRITETVLAGIVVDPEGRPVAGAHVGMGLDVTTSDDAGGFVFDLANEDSWNKRAAGYIGHVLQPEVIRAIKAGYLPGEVWPEPAAVSDGEVRWPDDVVVVLGGPPLAIDGVVVDAEGEPLPAMKVWLSAATLLGFDGRSSVHVEHELSGNSGRSWIFETTDEQGRFALEGLLDQEYVLEAMDPGTLLRVRSEPIPAGSTGVRIQLPADGVVAVLRGRVVSHDGEGVSGVNVHPMCDVFRQRFRDRIIGTSHAAVDGTLTDEDGAFELVNVPTSLVYLRLDGDKILPLEYGRSETDGAEHDDLIALTEGRWDEVVITVDQRCRFQVELSADTLADSVGMLDEHGEELILNLFQGNSRRTTERMALENGRSGTLGVSDAARTLVLYAGDEELRRMDVSLTPGEVEVLRP